MSRLIDADKLIEELKSAQLCIAGLREHKSFLGQTMTRYEKFIIKTIKEQPTAFDVDKVLKQLQSYKDDIRQWNDTYTSGQISAYEKAIAVVKAGGRDEKN